MATRVKFERILQTNDYDNIVNTILNNLNVDWNEVQRNGDYFITTEYTDIGGYMTALVAENCNNINVFHFLIEKGFTFKTYYYHGTFHPFYNEYQYKYHFNYYYPIHILCMFVDLDIFKMIFERCNLIEHIQICNENNNNNTPLHISCKYKNTDIIDYLIDNGADLDAENNYGRNSFETLLEPAEPYMKKITNIKYKYDFFLKNILKDEYDTYTKELFFEMICEKSNPYDVVFLLENGFEWTETSLYIFMSRGISPSSISLEKLKQKIKYKRNDISGERKLYDFYMVEILTKDVIKKFFTKNTEFKRTYIKNCTTGRVLQSVYHKIIDELRFM